MAKHAENGECQERVGKKHLAPLLVTLCVLKGAIRWDGRIVPLGACIQGLDK